MSKVESNLLTSNQVTKVIILTMIGVGFLSLPNNMVKVVKQDGWIIPIVSGIYPLYMVLIAAFLSKKHPNENILVLSKKYLGEILGLLTNFIFLISFILYLIFETAGIDNFLRTYIIAFLSSFQFLIVFIPFTAFAAYKGLKVLGTVSEIVFYIFILILLVTLLSLTKGSYLNLMPVLSNGPAEIVKGIIPGIYSYSGVEMILLVYPRVDDKSKIMYSSVKAILITCVAYTWIVFAAIFYFGVSIINKTLWSTLFVIESLRLPIINNFRFVAMFLWTFISVTVVSMYFYSCVFIIRDYMKKVSRKTIFIALTPLVMVLCLHVKTEVNRREFISLLLPYVVIYNVLYVTIIAILIIIKKGHNNEN